MSSITLHAELWNNILNFNFDLPVSEYGFSTRLADENNWTQNFTAQAILEYKKFMFLAGTSNDMVAPSPIVDIVWHQHLIFTQSYTAFCNTIGRQIQHIPSTHNYEEAEKFRQAQSRTKQLYQENFGEQPAFIWNATDIFTPLGLKRAHYNLQKIITWTLVAFGALSFPLYWLLRPVYVSINNPNFLAFYISISALLIISLAHYNKLVWKKLLLSIEDSDLFKSLSPNEVIYLKSQDLLDVVLIALDKLVKNGKLLVEGNVFKLKINEKIDSVEEYTILESIRMEEKFNSTAFLNKLQNKPCFATIGNSMDDFRAYIMQSNSYVKQFSINLGTVLLLIMGGWLRFLTGISRDKPVILIALCLIVLIVSSVIWLKRLSSMLFQQIIPEHFKTEIATYSAEENNGSDWQYFIIGPTLLSASLTDVMGEERRKKADWESDGFRLDGGGSSCSSDSGSSCSSCGGCGGD